MYIYHCHRSISIGRNVLSGTVSRALHRIWNLWNNMNSPPNYSLWAGIIHSSSTFASELQRLLLRLKCSSRKTSSHRSDFCHENDWTHLISHAPFIWISFHHRFSKTFSLQLRGSCQISNLSHGFQPNRTSRLLLATQLFLQTVKKSPSRHTENDNSGLAFLCASKCLLFHLSVRRSVTFW